MMTHPDLAILVYLALGSDEFRKELNNMCIQYSKKSEISYVYHP